MTYSQVLLLVFVSGSMGGLVYAVLALLDSGRQSGVFEVLKGVPQWAFFVGSALVGAGGAFALMLVLVTTNHFHADSTTDNLLFLTSVSLVAGFIGHRMLPEVAARLEKQIADASQKAEEAKRDTEEVKRQTQAVREEVKGTQRVAEQQAIVYSDISVDIVLALQALTAHNAEQIRRRIEILEEKRKDPQFPTHRTLHIVLGRLYAEGVQDYDKAIQVLKDFVTEKLKQGDAGRDVDFADAMFNIACYYALKMTKTGSDTEKREFRVQTLQAFRQSVAVSPVNALDATKDADFAPFWDDQEFRAIVESAQAKG